MKSILLAISNNKNRKSIKKILELANYKVFDTDNGIEAFNILDNQNIDLILSEIELEELDGFGLLHLINKKAETTQIPFIFISTDISYNQIRKGMNLGADDFFQIPMHDSEFLNALECRLNRNNEIRNSYLSHLQIESKEELSSILNFESIQDHLKNTSYNKSEFIFKDGEASTYIFYVKKGKVKTFLYSEQGKEYITGIFGKNEFLGYQALFENRKHNEYCEAITDCEIVKIDKNSFSDLILKNPDLAYQFLKILSEKLTDKENKLLHLAYSSVRKRLARTLLSLVKTNGKNTIKLSRSDLSHLVGTSSETLVRTLTEFKKDKIINSKYSSIEILDINKLKYIEKTS